MKKIFERILKLVELFDGNSQTSFAKKIGCQQSTFNSYMNDEGQRKIRLTLLDDILKVYPQVSREWLYLGEGEMLTSGQQPTAGHPVQRADSPANVVTLEAKELGQENTAQTEKLEQRIAELERENAELTVELRGALKELRQLNEERRELEERLKANPIDS